MVVSKSGNGKFPFEYENSLDAKNEDVGKYTLLLDFLIFL